MEHEQLKDFSYLNSIANLRTLRAGYFFRDIVTTGYAALDGVVEAAIMGGAASRFTDLVKISGTNTSTAAIAVDIRSGTGSGIMDTILIPSANTLTKLYEVPLASSEQNVPWTAQAKGTEATGAPITISMVGVKTSKRAF